ncbi:sensor histidine kinase [Plebeiibacterium marinum]|uniref:histidine kinase n=1 Tax=Plebeiibacterium marinum TaxID=2992111 RepID=A0AAE3MF01_9BACT|nr:ATP-binding protein [Plebeiobacterium marinum]MCW3806236.1 ATP-binding protein [Plebeiobacterium marinum]
MKLFYTTLLLFCCFHFSFGKEVKEILLLNSYHTGFKWTDDITQGVLDAIDEKEDYRLFVEYMDFKRFQNQGYFYELTNLYKYKYENIDLDGIICSDNYAFQYVLEKGDSIWNKSIPITACGVNNIDLIPFDTTRINVIKEDIDIKTTLQQAFILNPNTDTIIVISDQTLSGKIFLSQFFDGLNEFNPNIPFQIIDGTDYETIKTKLDELPHHENKMIILLSLYSNNHQVPIEMKHLGTQLLKDIDIPIYSFWEFLLGDFIVGGHLISSYDQGYEAAKSLLNRINNPEKKSNPLTPTQYKPTYDFNLLKKYNLNYKLLPPNTVFTNRTIPFYVKHKKKLIYYFSALALLILLNFHLISNIIKRKKIQKRLTDSERRLEMALESANEGLWDVSLNTNTVVFNRRFAKLLGYKHKKNISVNIKDWEKYVYDKDVVKIYANWKNYTKGSTPLFKTDIRIYQKDNTLKWYSVHGKITETDTNKKPVRITGVLMDISEQKEFENQLKKAKEKAEESDRLKSRFLANMSHEIRTPMNAILGFSDILQSPELNIQEKDEYLDQIKTSGENLLNIINDIVDISKIESDQLQIRNEKFNLNSTLNHVKYTAETIIKSKNKNIKFCLDYNLPELLIYSDPYRLEQVLLNLISNAIKFTQTGEVKLTVVPLKNNILLITVKDTGEGISPEDINIIFERFRQAEKTTKLNTGTGLGLAITKSLVELMGGFITVKSKLNKGSEFTISLPVLNSNNN